MVKWIFLGAFCAVSLSAQNNVDNGKRLYWYFDTSVLVPAAVARHPHNAPALAVLEELISRKHRGFIAPIA